jgi:hypothetical protein
MKLVVISRITFCFLGLLWFMTGSVMADPLWPVHLSGPPGSTPMYHVTAPNGANGAYVSFNDLQSNDVYVDQLSSDGEIIWSVADSVMNHAGYPQQVASIVANGQGSAAVLLTTNPPLPSWFRLVAFDSATGAPQCTTVVCDSLPGGRSQPRLIAADSIIFALWQDGRSGSSETYYHRIVLPSGQLLCDSTSRNGLRLGSGSYYYAVPHGNSLVVAAGDSVYCIDVVDGTVVGTGLGEELYQIHVSVIGDDTLLIAGINSGNLLLKCVDSNGLQWTQIVASGLTLPRELVVSEDVGQLEMFWITRGDIFYRSFSFENGLGNEKVVCDNSATQRLLRVARSDSGTIVAWQDRRNSISEVLFCKVVSGEIGREYSLGEIGEMQFDSFSLVESITYPLLIWSNNWQILIQPADPGLLEAVIQPHDQIVPNQFSLLPAYPNPFNSVVQLVFQLSKSGYIELVVYDTIGRRVTTVASGWFTAGRYEQSWSPTFLASGTYFVQLSQKGVSATQKLTYVK